MQVIESKGIQYSMKVFVAIAALVSFLASNSEAIGFAPDGPSALWGVVSRGGYVREISWDLSIFVRAVCSLPST